MAATADVDVMAEFQALYAMRDGSRKGDLVVLDTGDSYVLARRKPVVDLTLECALEVYASLQDEVQVVPLGGLQVTPKEFEEIVGVIGTVVEATPAEPLDAGVMRALELDVAKVLEFAEVRRRWARVSAADRAAAAATPTHVLVGSTGIRPGDLPSSPAARPADVTAHHVIYSVAHDMSVVKTALTSTVREMCERFPHFVSVAHFECRVGRQAAMIGAQGVDTAWHTVPTVADNASDAECDADGELLRKLFHLKPCNHDGVKSRVAAYSHLVQAMTQQQDDVAAPDGNSTGCPGTDVLKPNSASERAAIVAHVRSMYTLSNDEARRMRASDLYEQIGTSSGMALHVKDQVGFRRRLAGYLLAMGLVKKRYSDGYYYFGIEPRFQATCVSEEVAEQQFQDLVKQREALDDSLSYRSPEAAAHVKLDDLLKERAELRASPPPPMTDQERAAAVAALTKIMPEMKFPAVTATNLPDMSVLDLLPRKNAPMAPMAKEGAVHVHRAPSNSPAGVAAAALATNVPALNVQVWNACDIEP